MKRMKPKSSKVLRVFVLIALVIGSLGLLEAQFDGGDGSQNAPWEVRTAVQMNNVRNYLGADHDDKYFIQTAHIDIGDIEDWVPIGDRNAQFTGSYDGNGFEIRNLRRNTRSQYSGLFGQTLGTADNRVILRNINIRNMNFNASSFSGGLIGQAENTLIENCSVVGRYACINGEHGGLVGRTRGNTSIHRCWSEVIFTNSGHTFGGIVGMHGATGAITECYALVDITTNNTNLMRTGGIVGELTNGSVSDCYAIGTIVSTHETTGRIAGLVGSNSHWQGSRPVSRSFAIVTIVSTGAPLGGLIADGTGQITSSYWCTDLSGMEESPGGGSPLTTHQMIRQGSFVGWDFDNVWSMVEGSFPFLGWEEEPGRHSFPPGNMPPGNLSARPGFEVVNLTWDAPTIGDPVGYYIYRNNARINDGNLVEEERFDDEHAVPFTQYNYTVTAIYEGQQESEPSTAAIGFAHNYFGTGEDGDPFIVTNAAQLNGVRYFLSAHFRQTEHIDIGVYQQWNRIGTASGFAFTGVYDGGGYEIRNLTRTQEQMTGWGFFGYTGEAVLKNMHIVDMNFRARLRVGGLVGETRDTVIEDCSVSGTLIASNNTDFGGLVGIALGDTRITRCRTDVEITGGGRNNSGGLVGTLSGNSIIEESYSLGDVQARAIAGGLVGQVLADAQVTTSYARGEVVSAGDFDQIGGLIGLNRGRITNCYSTGLVSSAGDNVGGLIGLNTGEVTGSYWDTQTSNQDESAGGEGRMTRQMTHPYDLETTFINWDFDDIWANDFEDINDGYPVLAFQVEITYLDPPEVTISIIEIEGNDYVRLEWEAVENAQSYNIFSSKDPYLPFHRWNNGEPVATTGNTFYERRVEDEGVFLYYRVVSSVRE